MKKASLAFIGLIAFSLSCSTVININMGPATADTRPVVEIAAGKPTSASSYWIRSEEDNFPSDAIVDGKTVELNCLLGVPEGNSFWLLADKNTGWVQVDLMRNYPIVEIRWLNTHNGTCQDRATTKFHIAVSKRNQFNGEEEVVHRGEMQIETSPKFQSITLPHPVDARYIRFYVDAFTKNGGGLNELEVYVKE